MADDNPDQPNNEGADNDNDNNGGLHPLGSFIIAVLVILLLAFAGWFM